MCRDEKHLYMNNSEIQTPSHRKEKIRWICSNRFASPHHDADLSICASTVKLPGRTTTFVIPLISTTNNNYKTSPPNPPWALTQQDRYKKWPLVMVSILLNIYNWQICFIFCILHKMIATAAKIIFSSQSLLETAMQNTPTQHKCCTSIYTG